MRVSYWIEWWELYVSWSTTSASNIYIFKTIAIDCGKKKLSCQPHGVMLNYILSYKILVKLKGVRWRWTAYVK